MKCWKRLARRAELRRSTLYLLLPGLLISCAASQETTLHTQSNVVLIPALVKNQQGEIVYGLQAKDFVIEDDGVEQSVRLDEPAEESQPISLVIAIQCGRRASYEFHRIQRLNSMLEPIISQGHAKVSVVTFDSQVQALHDFTGNANRITQDLNDLQPGDGGAAILDAVDYSVKLLEKAPQEQQRVLLLISETRDGGSEGKMRDTLIATEVNNVLVYTINMNRLLNTLNAKTPVPRPDPIPASAHNVPAGGAPTPNSIMQNSGWGANTVPLFVEIFRDVKSIFIDNPAELLTKYTGGTEYSFLTQHNLEDAVSKIGEELHSQYLINYSPNNKLEGGWHHIKVTVSTRAATVKTRTGYWLAGVPE